MPQISVVVTAHNNAGLLARCLAAVVESRHRDLELIVVDDASADETVMTAKRFTDKVIAFESHRGRNAARMAGYTLAKGDLIINLDADVVVFPDTFEKVIASFAAHPEAISYFEKYIKVARGAEEAGRIKVATAVLAELRSGEPGDEVKKLRMQE